MSFNTTYYNDGKMTVEVTAWNLHEDPDFGANKYRHNFTQIIHVQKAVMDWTFVGDDYWIRDNGGE